MTGCVIQWWYKSPVICLVNSANEVLTSVMTHKRWCAINHVQDQVCKGWVNILSLDSGLLIICFALSLQVQTWTQRRAGTGHSVTTPQMQPVSASPPQRWSKLLCLSYFLSIPADKLKWCSSKSILCFLTHLTQVHNFKSITTIRTTFTPSLSSPLPLTQIAYLQQQLLM